MTPAEQKEIACILRERARQLKKAGHPIFKDQILRLIRNADKLDPPEEEVKAT